MRRAGRRWALPLAVAVLAVAACGAPNPLDAVTLTSTVTPTVLVTAARPGGQNTDPAVGESPVGSSPWTEPDPGGPSEGAGQGSVAVPSPSQAAVPSATLAFAGDVHFEGRVGERLAADPTTVFGAAAASLSAADLTMVNLETAITTGGTRQPKQFTFRAPASALTALAAGGIDVASMANNHGADFGTAGITDSLAAIEAAHFPVIGLGADADAAYRPFTTTVNGLRIAIFAATQVRDHTLAAFTAGPGTPGVASAVSTELVDRVAAAVSVYDAVIVFLHWGTEYESCPNSDQADLADRLAAVGVTAVVGAHAHVLQGAGWRPDGTYVAYGLSNYLWWRSFGNERDDNGILTLTVQPHAVVAASFAPAHLDDTGVPEPATGAQADRIDAEWERVRDCAGLLAAPPTR